MGTLIDIMQSIPCMACACAGCGNSISDKHVEYAETVFQKLKGAGVRVELGDRASMNYKVKMLRTGNSVYACDGR